MFGWLFRRRLRESDRGGRGEGQTTHANDGDVTPEEVSLTAVARVLDLQMTTNDVFDNRTSHAFSIGSTVLPVTFGLLGVSARQVSPVTISMLALALVFRVWRASRIRVRSYRPSMDALRKKSEIAPGAVLQRWVASEYVESTECNKPRLDRKGLWVGSAIASLYAEGFLLSAAAISTLL